MEHYYAELNPNDPFDRVINGAYQAELRAEVSPILKAYERGLVTVEEMVDRMNEVIERVRENHGG